MTDRLKSSWPYIVAGCITIIICWPILNSGVWYAGDILYEFYFNRAYGFGQLKQGEVPLWNPFQFNGYPFLGSLQSGLFYPLNLLFLIFSVETALALTLLIHLFLAWLFMYVLLYSWLKDSLASFTGGVIFMLSSTFTAHVYAGHITFLNAYPWMPLILYFYRKGFKGASPVNFILAGSCAGFQFLTGYPQISLFTMYLVLIYTSYEIFVSVNRKELLKRIAVPFIFSGIMAFLISAIQLIPTLFFNRFSGRSDGLQESFATSFSVPPENTITMLFPSILGDGVNVIAGTNTAYWGRWLLWEVLPYFGVFGFMCFVIAFTLPNKRTLFINTLIFLALLASYGMYGYLYEYIFRYVPGFSLFRVPGRFLILVAFGISVLVCYLMNQMKEKDFAIAFSKQVMLVSSIFIVFTLFLMGLLLNNNNGDSMFWRTLIAFVYKYEEARFSVLPLSSPDFLKGTYQHVFNKLTLGLFLLGGLIALSFVFYKTKRMQWFRLSLCLFVILDLFCFSQKYFKGNGSYTKSFSPEVEKFLESLNHSRIATKIDTQQLSVGSLKGIPHVGGYDPAQLRVYSEFVNALSGREPSAELVISEPIRPGNLLPLMSVKYVLTQKDMSVYPNSKKIGSFDDVTIYELNKTLPRAYFAKGFAVEPDKDKRLTKLTETYLLLERVILSEKTVSSISLDRFENDTIEWVLDKPHEVSMKLKTSENRLLVLTDSYYPLWRAYLNGKIVPIIQANHLFRAVEIPKGEHLLEFKYNKKPFYLSLCLSLFGIMILLMAVVYSFLQKRGVHAKE